MLFGALITDSSQTGNKVRQLYVAERNSGRWDPSGLLEGPVNDPDVNTGNAVISDDGQRMYFTRSRVNWQNREISEIYLSHNENGQWQRPAKLPYPVNMENHTSTQPALGKNLRTGEDILYFVSDRPGTKGGLISGIRNAIIIQQPTGSRDTPEETSIRPRTTVARFMTCRHVPCTSVLQEETGMEVMIYSVQPFRQQMDRRCKPGQTIEYLV